MTNFAETNVTQTVDLNEYNPGKSAGSLYRMTSTSLTKASTSGTSQQVTFAPGETIVWTFPPGVSCDVNGDGSVNIIDVQLMINQALGMSACSDDIDQDGKCDIVDVQRVINAALSGACHAGT